MLECFLVEGGFRFIVLDLLGKDLKCIFKEWYAWDAILAAL